MIHLLHVASTSTSNGSSSININLGNSLSKPSDSVMVLIALTLLALAPSLLILLTGFTRIIIVFSLLRQALGLNTVPPNQVLAGLSLILSLFIMSPTLKQMNNVALQPYLKGQMNATQAYDKAQVPLKTWMLKQTGSDELALTTSVDGEHPATANDTSMAAVVPAFMLSQLKSGMLIGFVIFIPFLIIDLVVAAILMSMGAVMLPPTLVSLPFKLLLFVMVNGWILVTHSLIVSFK